MKTDSYFVEVEPGASEPKVFCRPCAQLETVGEGIYNVISEALTPEGGREVAACEHPDHEANIAADYIRFRTDSKGTYYVLGRGEEKIFFRASPTSPWFASDVNGAGVPFDETIELGTPDGLPTPLLRVMAQEFGAADIYRLLSDDKRKQIAREDGEAAFWRAVAAAFPECKTGDFPPGADFRLTSEMATAINYWFAWNKWQTGEDGDA